MVDWILPALHKHFAIILDVSRDTIFLRLWTRHLESRIKRSPLHPSQFNAIAEELFRLINTILDGLIRQTLLLQIVPVRCHLLNSDV